MGAIETWIWLMLNDFIVTFIGTTSSLQYNILHSFYFVLVSRTCYTGLSFSFICLSFSFISHHCSKKVLLETKCNFYFGKERENIFFLRVLLFWTPTHCVFVSYTCDITNRKLSCLRVLEYENEIKRMRNIMLETTTQPSI